MRDMPVQATHHPAFPRLTSPERHRSVMWLVISVLAALVGYFGFRGYLTPELLFHFANSLVC
jgi:hypothetical protein